MTEEKIFYTGIPQDLVDAINDAIDPEFSIAEFYSSLSTEDMYPRIPPYRKARWWEFKKTSFGKKIAAGTS